jgi:hypothetical protein
MQNKVILILTILIVIGASIATLIGILSAGGTCPATFQSIHGNEVILYGKGIYKYMSVDVAPQGIAQDWVTLLAGIPLLIASLVFSRKGSVRYRILLAGVTGYFMLTYMFYLAMAVYNPLFLLYAALFGLSFFSLTVNLIDIFPDFFIQGYSGKVPLRFAGGFLIFNAVAIASLWLGVVVPPLIDGSIYPKELAHYTTLIVQGYDLGFALPIAAVIGILLLKRNRFGLLLGPVYLVFLTILMMALVGKIIAMGIAGYPIIPAIFLIPPIMLISGILAFRLLNGIKTA